MQRCFLFALFAAVAAGGLAAEETFSRAVPAADFAAAGLGKLSPEELARLDALVRDFKAGAPAAARRETAAVEARAERAEARASQAAEKPAGGPPARVRLAPGTAVDYEPVESRIAGEFRGWQGRAIFLLENGQRWQVANTGTSYYSPPLARPKVKIVPAALGAFWLSIEGVDQRVKVLPLGDR